MHSSHNWRLIFSSYIKELAERVVSLERASGATPYTPIAHGLTADFNTYSPSPDFLGPDGRKRSHSAVDGSQNLGSSAEQLQTFAKGYTPNMSSAAQDGANYRSDFDPSQGMSGDVGSLGGEPIDEYVGSVRSTKLRLTQATATTVRCTLTFPSYRTPKIKPSSR